MEIKTFCGKMCGASCGVIVKKSGDRIVNVKGDPDYPPTGGYICPKGLAFPELIYHKDRITKPLKRVGLRGSGKWEEISTEKALQIINDKLGEISEQYGSESIVIHRGAFRNDLVTDMLIRLGKAIGTPNIANLDNVCSMARAYADEYTYGMRSFPDYRTPSKCIVAWGRNSLETGSESMINILIKALENKAKILVIDPRKTSIAEKATLWIKPKPGSDGYLALALIKTIIEKKLYDQDFIKNWTVGFEELVRLVNRYEYDMLSENTWIPLDEIQNFALIYASTKPASIQTGNPIDQTPNAFHTSRLISILRAITGNIDVPGGDFLYSNVLLNDLKDIPDRSKKKMIGHKYRVAAKEHLTPSQETLRTALTGKPYPVKASLMFGTNPLLTYVDTKNTFKALEKIDFILTIEFFLSTTAKYSDLILPAAGNHEYEDLSPRAGHINVRPKIIEPPGECYSDIQWVNLIARKMGLKEFWDNEEDVYNYVLKPLNKTYKEIVKKGTIWFPQRYYKYESEGFKTPSGKVEIHSESLNKMGISPVPKIIKQTTNTSDYPLILTSGKDPFSYHSSFRQLVSLRRLSKEPLVEINPKTAHKHGLNEGDFVIIETSRGSIKQKVSFNHDLDPRIVYAAFGWWFPEQECHGWKIANLNILTDWDEPLCEAMGAATLRGIPCRLSV